MRYVTWNSLPSPGKQKSEKSKFPGWKMINALSCKDKFEIVKGIEISFYFILFPFLNKECSLLLSRILLQHEIHTHTRRSKHYTHTHTQKWKMIPILLFKLACYKHQRVIRLVLFSLIEPPSLGERSIADIGWTPCKHHVSKTLPQSFCSSKRSD